MSGWMGELSIANQRQQIPQEARDHRVKVLIAEQAMELGRPPFLSGRESIRVLGRVTSAGLTRLNQASRKYVNTLSHSVGYDGFDRRARSVSAPKFLTAATQCFSFLWLAPCSVGPRNQCSLLVSFAALEKIIGVGEEGEVALSSFSSDHFGVWGPPWPLHEQARRTSADLPEMAQANDGIPLLVVSRCPRSEPVQLGS